MFQSWNVIPFQWSKQRARLLDADQFTWSQLRVLNENLKDHLWIRCANKTSQNNKAKSSETFCILGFELQNAAQQLSLRQQSLNVGLRVNFWSAPHWEVQATIRFTKIANHTVGGVGVAFFCCACWFLFFFDNILFVYYFWIQKVFGMDAGLGLKKVAQQ